MPYQKNISSVAPSSAAESGNTHVVRVKAEEGRDPSVAVAIVVAVDFSVFISLPPHMRVCCVGVCRPVLTLGKENRCGTGRKKNGGKMTDYFSGPAGRPRFHCFPFPSPNSSAHCPLFCLALHSHGQHPWTQVPAAGLR